MKIGILSGAVKNAGDFLIVDRTVQLLKHYYQNAQLIKIHRNKPLDEILMLLNSCDALILAGGPLVMEHVYPEAIPLTRNLASIKPPLISIGVGWHGIRDSSDYLYQYRFSPSSKNFLKRLSRDVKFIGCRDFLTIDVLKNNNIKNVIMSGCPAWYNLKTVNKTVLRNGIKFPYRKICISDPAKQENFTQSFLLAKMLRKQYKDAKVLYICHSKNNHQWAKNLENIGVEYVDISGGIHGLNIYDNCDLHIGYRVHAHIYNLSQRNISILIEEDARGAGVDKALGLSSIKAYALCSPPPKYSIRFLKHSSIETENSLNKYALKEINDYLSRIEFNDFRDMEYAYMKMLDYFYNMEMIIQNMNG